MSEALDSANRRARSAEAALSAERAHGERERGVRDQRITELERENAELREAIALAPAGHPCTSDWPSDVARGIEQLLREVPHPDQYRMPETRQWIVDAVEVLHEIRDLKTPPTNWPEIERLCEVERASFALTAALTTLAPGYEAGEAEFLRREAVMDLVVKWRQRFDAASANKGHARGGSQP